MTRPFPRIRPARRYNTHDTKAQGIDDREETVIDAAKQAKPRLTIIVTRIELDPTCRIGKGGLHVSKAEATLAKAAGALCGVPFEDEAGAAGHRLASQDAMFAPYFMALPS
jgi:hypothetical protein